MAGLVIDVLIAFLVKLILRFKRSWGSGKWELVKAKIDASSVGGGWVWNCPTTEVAYTYKYDSKRYRVVDKKPFFLNSSAKTYVERFKSGEIPFVRVKPDEPERSVLRRADQPDWEW